GTLGDLLALYPAALGYFLFAPFPWAGRSLTQWLAVPDMLLWYALIPFTAVGAWAAIRRPLAWGPLAFALLYMLAVAPITANVGTLHRQRIVFWAACFVPAAAGLVRFAAGRRAGRPDARRRLRQ